MSADTNNSFIPGPAPNTVRAADGKVLTVPNGWVLLPPGDAALTRRVKAAGGHWVVKEKKGRRLFSKGVWVPAMTIQRLRGELEAERSTESFAKRKKADAKRREQAQEVYVEDFTGAVVTFLAFHPNHADLAQRLARVVAPSVFRAIVLKGEPWSSSRRTTEPISRLRCLLPQVIP